jgi:uncharacterized membrane protein YhhN
MTLAPVYTCSIAVAALLAAEARGWRPGIAICKLAAAGCFVWAAWAWGASATAYGRSILAALVLCACGDALLVPRGRGTPFQLGIGAFLLGHAAFAAAFLTRPQSAQALLLAGCATAAVGLGVWRWLSRHLPAAFRAPVVAYVVTISCMVVASIGATTQGAPTATAVGALAFAASDLSVARDRFVAPGFANAAWGLPLYFAAQILLASTVL